MTEEKIGFPQSASDQSIAPSLPDSIDLSVPELDKEVCQEKKVTIEDIKKLLFTGFAPPRTFLILNDGTDEIYNLHYTSCKSFKQLKMAANLGDPKSWKYRYYIQVHDEAAAQFIINSLNADLLEQVDVDALSNLFQPIRDMVW